MKSTARLAALLAALAVAAPARAGGPLRGVGRALFGPRVVERATCTAGARGVAYTYTAAGPAGRVAIRRYMPNPVAASPCGPAGCPAPRPTPQAVAPTQVYPVPTSSLPRPAPAGSPAAYGDPYGFIPWLNATRAQYGLRAVGYDPDLTNWAARNNAQQNARGMGHHVMGPARRQNSAMGNYASIGAMWMASPAHRAALLDPTISFVGIAGAGAYWTLNAY